MCSEGIDGRITKTRMAIHVYLLFILIIMGIRIYLIHKI